MSAASQFQNPALTNAKYYSQVIGKHNRPVNCFFSNDNSKFLRVAGKDELKVLGHETLAVSKIASACEESARTGQSVELTWGTDALPLK
jgi:hypothetical protein